MATVFGFIFLISLCFITIQIFEGIRNVRQKRYYTSLYKAELTKSYFAEARNELMGMAIAGKIDANSSYFKDMYRLNTIIMRAPDQYEKISMGITKVLLDINTFKNTSSSNLTESEKHILRLTAKALGQIVIEYTFPFRLLYHFMKWTERDFSKDRFIFHIAGITRDLAKVKANEEIAKAKQELLTMADIGRGSMEHYDYAAC